MNEFKILLIDDHPMMRAALKAAIQNQTGLQVAGEAGTLGEGRRLIDVLQPDLLLLDLYLPDGNGKELITYRNAHCPRMKVLVVTSASDEEVILAVLKAGVDGMIGKNAPAERVQYAIREVLGGRCYLMEEATQILLRAFQQRPGELKVSQDLLSEREQGVIALLARGASNQDIAAELVISESTVRSHLQRISQKIGTQNKRELVLYFAKHYKEFVDEELWRSYWSSKK